MPSNTRTRHVNVEAPLATVPSGSAGWRRLVRLDRRRIAAVAAAGLLVTGLAGCGSAGDSAGTPSPTASSTASADQAAGQGSAAGKADGAGKSGSAGKAGSAQGELADAKALQQAVTKATQERKYVKIEVTNGTGSAVTRAEYAGANTKTHTKAGNTETITIGPNAYVKSHGVWTRSLMPISDSAGIESKLAGELRDLGSQKVDGTPTTHYRTTAGIDQLIAASAGDNKKLLQQTKKLGVAGYVTDLWISAEHLPVKAVVSVNGGPKVPTTTMRFSDWGKPFTIKAPKLG